MLWPNVRNHHYWAVMVSLRGVERFPPLWRERSRVPPPAAMSSGATASGEPLPQPLSEDEKAKLQAEGIWPDDLVEAMDREPEILAEYRAASPEEAVELLRAHVMRLVYVGGDDADDDDNDAANESERVG